MQTDCAIVLLIECFLSLSLMIPKPTNYIAAEVESMKSEEPKGTIEYFGNAEDIILPAEKLGWVFDREKFPPDENGYIDWDAILEDVSNFLKEKGIDIQYS